MKNLPIKADKWIKSLPKLVLNLYNNSNFKNEGVSPLEKTIHELLFTNFTLWGYENEARRKDVPDKYIADLKRNIDIQNQKRNDLIDTIDAILRQDVEKKLKSISPKLPINSETPSSIFDRLTILALRQYHLKKEIERKDANKSHTQRCSTMLKEVKERSSDLLKCLENLLEDVYLGKKRLKSYKQHKLYNDPELNPSLRK